MLPDSFLLYGANGYTGELIARFAADQGLVAILAGRRESALEPLSHRLNLPYIVFDLNDKEKLISALQNVKAVLHAAGPFQFTAKQMVEACIETKTHYIDINGDINIFELLKTYDWQAKEAGIMVMPGAGFDVVPTDCIALLLKKTLPDATSLKLAFVSTGGGVSHGTATTMINKLGEGGLMRKDGMLIPVALGKHGMTVDFFTGAGKNNHKLFVMSIPWGDISTAHFTTGIPCIETFTGISKNVYRFLVIQSLYNWLLRTGFIRGFIKKKINEKPAGPSDAIREKSRTFIWGNVTNAKGRSATAKLAGPDGYTFTMYSSLIIIKKILEGKFKTGYQTPSKVYGEDFVLEIPGVERDAVQFV
ncbi:MAG TPA: saccharopine dehydrogenase NADP-binding domain-containing protein [Ferruginibacter sp.]|nr:saccharopine dehydrogenase NADP-binding domain-containing protein [Ferruginibacter sp.]